MKSLPRLFLRVVSASAVFALLYPAGANAVPSFARQTGMACAACHNGFPELTRFGRQFKLDGYVFTGKEQIEDGKGDEKYLKISAISPFSVMVQASYTDTKGANKSDPGTRGNFDFPQQFSLFYAGEIAPNLGAFLQVTHSDNSAGFGMDNSELRYARHLDLGSKDLLVGAVINNNPSMSDVWQTTPVWGYPYQSPLSFEKPLSWGVGQQVGGVGAYALLDNSWYGELMLYKAMGSGGQNTPLTDPWGDPTVSSAVDGWAPYWRLAYQGSFGDNYIEVGAFGMTTKLYGTAAGASNGSTTATTGPADTFSDLAIDAQYERPFGDDSLTVHAVAAREKIKPDAYRINNPDVTQPDVTFKVFNLNGTYHFGANKALTLAMVRTSGDGADPASYQAGIKTGTNALVGEGAYYPWQNVRLSLQYVKYSRYLGTSSGASDNNSIYALAWVLF